MPPTVPAAFEAVEISYWALSPMIVLLVGAFVGVLVEAFAPRGSKHLAQVGVSVVTILLALGALLFMIGDEAGVTVGGTVAVDGPTRFMQGALLVLGLLGLLVMADRLGGDTADAFTPMGAAAPGSDLEAQAARKGWSTTEVFPLALFALAGMLLFPASNDLLTMFVALELLSLPLYLMSGLARRRRLLSQEAALKYFLLGAFSSGFFLFGAALLYGYAGSIGLPEIAAAASTSTGEFEGLLLPGVVMVIVGLLFKVGAVPFHSWTPDVYQGAPTPVTGFMAACTKAAAFGALLRLLYVGLETTRWEWRMGVVVIAALTMVVGSVLSVTQTDIKRLLAYSSIAHAGFIIVALVSFDRSAVEGVLFYVVAYGISTIAAFAIVNLVRERDAEATHLSQWAGLGRRHPWISTAFALLMLAFAGIPLTSGFTAKVAAFMPAIEHGGLSGVVLVVIGVLMSAITAFVYIRLIVLMFFTEPSGDVTAASPATLSLAVIVVGVIVTIALGVFPGPLLELAEQSSIFITR
ncbi:NADH-quinone oxidoreductase subunit NuoN [Janibacter anophelis]|uniref:NADH-quinone oxidoreductase subunit NuoN n=1 Tax=Janibacter anophelis TaxID=319054 RepID=UPI000834092E|nr:NADH-quinone oxidoreductase subunit NuoN [Janibacter anophelis]